MSKVDVSLGLTLTDVTPQEIAPLLTLFATMAQRAQVSMPPETRRFLARHAPDALVGANGASALSASRVIAALTDSAGNVAAAARALGVGDKVIMRVCREAHIIPSAFRRLQEEVTP